MKFHQNILNGYQVIERTRFCGGQTDGWTQGESNMSPDPVCGNNMAPDPEGERQKRQMGMSGALVLLIA